MFLTDFEPGPLCVCAFEPLFSANVAAGTGREEQKATLAEAAAAAAAAAQGADGSNFKTGSTQL